MRRTADTVEFLDPEAELAQFVRHNISDGHTEFVLVDQFALYDGRVRLHDLAYRQFGLFFGGT